MNDMEGRYEISGLNYVGLYQKRGCKSRKGLTILGSSSIPGKYGSMRSIFVSKLVIAAVKRV